MNKRKLGFIVFMVVALISLVVYKVVDSNHNTYKVIETQKINESNGEIEGVIKAIDNSTQSKINAIPDTKDIAYIVINCENINKEDLNTIINEAANLGLKLTFTNTKDKELNENILSLGGNNIIPNGANLQEALKKEGVKTFKLNETIEVSHLDNQGVVIYVDNILSLGKNNEKIKMDVLSLKNKGYRFKALA